MTIFNLEYRILDKLERTKKTIHGGVFMCENSLEQAKQKILESIQNKKITFDVYVIERSSPFNS